MGSATQHRCGPEGTQPVSVAKAGRSRTGILFSLPPVSSLLPPARSWGETVSGVTSHSTEQREGLRADLGWRDKGEMTSTMVKGI